MNEHEVDPWDNTESDSLAAKYSKGIYFRLQNHGDKETVVFGGLPHAKEKHWIDGAYKDCTGAGCALCTKNVKIGLRIKLNVFVIAEGEWKIWECGAQPFKDAKDCRRKYGKDAPFEIKRHGRANDPKTKYSILPENKPLTAEQKTRMLAAPMHNLAEAQDDSVTEGAPKEEGTISGEARKEFIDRLKNLGSEEALNTFLGKFACERIGDVPASEEQAARRLIEQLERQRGKPSAREPEINPYS
jgi:hypothetical protein